MTDTSAKTKLTFGEIIEITTELWFKKHSNALSDEASVDEITSLINDLRELLNRAATPTTRAFLIEQLFFIKDVPDKVGYAIQCLCIEYAGDLTLKLQEQLMDFDCPYGQREATHVTYTNEISKIERYTGSAEKTDEDVFHQKLLERMALIVDNREPKVPLTDDLTQLFQQYVDNNLPGHCAHIFAHQAFQRFHNDENLTRLIGEAKAAGKNEGAVRVLEAALEALTEQ